MLPTPTARATAAALQAQRGVLSRALADVVGGWAKYADRYSADPAGFADEEKGAIVDYLVRHLETGDDTFRQLIVGERVKQFYRPDLEPADQAELVREVQARERAILLKGLSDDQSDLLSRILDKVDSPLLLKGNSTLRVLFVGDCLFLDVTAFLVPACAELGITIEPHFVATKDRVEERAQISKLADKPFDLIFYSPLTYEAAFAWGHLMAPRFALRPAKQIRSDAMGAVEEARPTLDLLAQLFESSVFVHLPAGVYRHTGRWSDLLRVAAVGRARRIALPPARAALEAMIDAANARSIRHVFALDEQPIVDSVGVWESGKEYYSSHLQHPAVFGRTVAKEYAKIAFVHARLAKRKLIVCDLDNTLWDGIIGEGNGVTHHADRQSVLLDLKRKGVVLAINSKNDRRNVVWGEGALLGDEDFVSSQINWDPKVLNMQRIADHLNLKPKDFVFIDDRADERALVSEAFPGLLSLDALDPATWTALADWAAWLPDSSVDRTLFYKQREERKAFLETEVAVDEAARGEALAKLGLKAIIREAAPADLARVTELINRTNQFNTAASRVTRADINALHENPQARILVATVEDRYGDMGLVSVLVLRAEGDTATVLHFVLSCRVFGYAVEDALLAAVRGATPLAIQGRIVETPYNEPCRTVFADAGFSDEAGLWTLAAGKPVPSTPDWLAIDRQVTPL